MLYFMNYNTTCNLINHTIHYQKCLHYISGEPLTATLIYTILAGKTTAAGTRLALQLILVIGFEVYSFWLKLFNAISPIQVFTQLYPLTHYPLHPLTNYFLSITSTLKLPHFPLLSYDSSLFSSFLQFTMLFSDPNIGHLSTRNRLEWKILHTPAL